MNEVVSNPWVVQAPKQKADLPIGMYVGPFKGIADVTLPTGESRWRFEWAVSSGEHQGTTASALCDKAINPNTLPGRLIAGLLGRQLVVGEDVKASIDACIGQTYVVSVQAGPQGGRPGVKSAGKPPAM